MRKTFIKTLIELAREDERIFLLTADLGFMVVEPFVHEFPNRFMNVGVAEQNMIGVASGLAMNGFVPFAYSIATFAALRPYEFIRNCVCAHTLPVRIVGIGTGVEYSHDGMTHHSLEDVALMRMLPRMAIIAPCDDAQVKTALEATYALPVPIYYRLSKTDNVTIPALNGRFTFGGIELCKAGKDALILSHGTVTKDVMDAALLLEHMGVSVSVAALATLAPLPVKELLLLLSGYKTVLTYEPHSPMGGMGSSIAEVIAEYDLRCRLVRNGIISSPGDKLGSLAYMSAQNKMDVESIVETVRGLLLKNLSAS